MKKELIKTEDYLLVVDDSKIKEDDYRVNIQRYYVKLADKEGLDYYNKRSDVFKKAIAHLPLNDSPILEGVPLLPPLDEGVFITPTHFEFEMRDALISPMGREVDPMNFDQNQSSCIWQKVIKTTTNSQGQQVACGKYIFEL